MNQRKIIHVDMDAFYASVEQRDFPELKGKPVVVGSPKQRGVIAAASYEARQYGVYSAMPSVVAIRKCPNLIFQPHRFSVYTEVSKQIREIFFQYTELIEPLSLDEAYLDVTQNQSFQGSATLLAKEIKNKIKEKTQLTASAGVSYNKFLAKIASDYRKPDGLFTIKPNEGFTFLQELDIKKFYGIGKVTTQRLKEMNIHKGKDLYKLDLLAMDKLFGKNGLFFYNMVRGIDNRPVQPHQTRKSISVENTYENDLTTTFGIITELYHLEKRLMRDIERLTKGIRTVTLKVRFSDFKTITRSKTISVYISSYEDIKKIIRDLLQEVDRGEKGIRLLGVGVSNFYEENGFVDNQLKLDFKVRK